MLEEIIESVKTGKNEGMTDTELLLMNVENTESIYHDLRKTKNVKDFKKVVMANFKDLYDYDNIDLKKVDWEEAFISFFEE